MSKVRNVAKHLVLEVAKGSRQCHTNKRHTIQPGDLHLAQYIQPGIRENICRLCAGAVLRRAAKHLENLRERLEV